MRRWAAKRWSRTSFIVSMVVNMSRVTGGEKAHGYMRLAEASRKQIIAHGDDKAIHENAASSAGQRLRSIFSPSTGMSSLTPQEKSDSENISLKAAPRVKVADRPSLMTMVDDAPRLSNSRQRR